MTGMKRHIIAGAAILAIIMIACPGPYQGPWADSASSRGGGVLPSGVPIPGRPPDRGVERQRPSNETGQEARERVARQAEREQTNESARPDDMPKKGDTAEHQRERENLR